MKFEIRRITAEDAKVIKEIRLKALKSDPYAFAGTYDNESDKEESYWLNWCRECAVSDVNITFLAFSEGQCIGLVGVIVDGDAHNASLCTMWVDNRYRGQGVSDALVRKSFLWAKSRKVLSLEAWVTEHNPGAQKFYKKMGFKETDRKKSYAPDPEKCEILMVKELVE